jgi:hypothetical protein
VCDLTDALDAAQSRPSLEVAGHITGAFDRARNPKVEETV